MYLEQQNNRIPELIDPLTGEVREAGSFSNAEWNQILKNNPDAATLILELRRKEDKLGRLEQENNNVIGNAIGAISAGVSFPLLNSIAPEIGSKLGREWIERTWAKPGQNIYEGNNVVLETTPERQLRLTVDGSTVKKPESSTETSFRGKAKQVLNELEEIPHRWASFLNEEGNKRLYFAIPEDSDGLGKAREKRFKSIGLEPKEFAGLEVFANDQRPGAAFLGKGYHLIDDLIFRSALAKHTGKADNALKALRFAGALSAALGIGSLIGGGINFINERI